MLVNCTVRHYCNSHIIQNLLKAPEVSFDGAALKNTNTDDSADITWSSRAESAGYPESGNVTEKNHNTEQNGMGGGGGRKINDRQTETRITQQTETRITRQNKSVYEKLSMEVNDRTTRGKIKAFRKINKTAFEAMRTNFKRDRQHRDRNTHNSADRNTHNSLML